MDKYKVTCLNCKAQREIFIINGTVDWLENPDNANHSIRSARKRLDKNWGFECACGNNDLMTSQEKKRITNKQSPDPKEIKDIIKSLIPDKPKFVMEKAHS